MLKSATVLVLMSALLAGPQSEVPSNEAVTCWGCFYNGISYECLPVQQFGWRSCSANPSGCTMGSTCAYTFSDISADGTVAPENSSESDDVAPLTSDRIEMGRDVSRNCSGAIVSRNYDTLVTARLRSQATDIRI